MSSMHVVENECCHLACYIKVENLSVTSTRTRTAVKAKKRQKYNNNNNNNNNFAFNLPDLYTRGYKNNNNTYRLLHSRQWLK